MCHHVCIPLAQMSRGIQYRFGEWITHFEGSKIAEVSLQISYCELWELELQNVQITQKSCRHLLAIVPSFYRLCFLFLYFAASPWKG